MENDALAWRTFLGKLISDPQEKQRLADAMGVNPITLTRWASTGTRSYTDMENEEDRRPRPHRQTIRKFVAALPPDYRDPVIHSLLQEFEDFTTEDFLARKLYSNAEEPQAIQVTCYEAVMEAAANLSGALRFVTIFDHLLDYTIQQLDPERLGLAVLVVQCTKPAPGQKVRSLREQFRMGTPPWRREREERNLFVGAGSLAGQAITTCRPYDIEDIRSYTGFLPVHNASYEISIAAHPIMRTGRVAGCLLFSSTQPSYFTRERIRLIQKYSHLALEAFNEDEYYDQHDIELRLMPEAEQQETFLRLFNKHVEELLMQGKATHRTQAEQMVIRQIEDDLIYLSSPYALATTQQ